MKQRWYVGYTRAGNRYLVRVTGTPTREMYEHAYSYMIGPFRTLRAAKYVEGHNVCFDSIREVEREAALYARIDREAGKELFQ